MPFLVTFTLSNLSASRVIEIEIRASEEPYELRAAFDTYLPFSLNRNRDRVTVNRRSFSILEVQSGPDDAEQIVLMDAKTTAHLMTHVYTAGGALIDATPTVLKRYEAFGRFMPRDLE